MIKKRNLDNSLIQWIMTVTGLGPGVGEIHYVAPAQSSTSQFRTQLQTMGVERTQPIYSTVQAAITAKVDYRNDVILVMPGTYAETVVDAIYQNAHLIGLGVTPDAVILAPTDGHALAIGTDAATTASMVNSSIRNMTFLTPSTSNATYAALLVTVMVGSLIDNCKFKGTTITGFQPTETVGLQLGSKTDTPWEFPEHSKISNCEFTSNAGRNKEIGIGIRVGGATVANPEYKGFKSMIIENNLIGAYDTGILLKTGSSSCNGTVIRNNIITSHQGGIGPNEGIVSGSTDGTDALCMIISNKITAIADCIRNFAANNTQNNIVSANGATPDTEYHDGS